MLPRRFTRCASPLLASLSKDTNKAKLPQSPWPKDPKLKDLGRYHQVNMFEAIGPYCYALFTRILGWSKEEIEVMVAGIRKELRDPSVHVYTKVHVLYGQKPE